MTFENSFIRLTNWDILCSVLLTCLAGEVGLSSGISWQIMPCLISADLLPTMSGDSLVFFGFSSVWIMWICEISSEFLWALSDSFSFRPHVVKANFIQVSSGSVLSFIFLYTEVYHCHFPAPMVGAVTMVVHVLLHHQLLFIQDWTQKTPLMCGGSAHDGGALMSSRAP